MADFQHINELLSLFGGSRELRKVGSKVKALVNHHFGDWLIFGLVESVNFERENLSGEGVTFVFSPFEDDTENRKIMTAYESVIKEVKAHKNPVSSFWEWYHTNTWLYLHQNESPTIIDSESSGWRLHGYPQRKEEKAEIGSFDSIEGESGSFEEYAKNYLKLFQEILHSSLGLSQYPYYAILVKPIGSKFSGQTTALGNIYMVFATSHPLPLEFYERLVNDMVLVWMNDHGGQILGKIREDANLSATAKVTGELKLGYPNVFTSEPRLIFPVNVSNKISMDFGNSKKKLSDFFDHVFNSVEKSRELSHLEDIILEEFLAAMLFRKTWLKAGLKCRPIDQILSEIKPVAQHNLFDSFDEESIRKFIRILHGRHLINILACLFSYDARKIHGLLTATDELAYGSLGDTAIKNRIGPYFNGYFVYCPKGKNILELGASDFYLSASSLEQKFLRRCVGRIASLIDESRVQHFNKSSLIAIDSNTISPRMSKNNMVSKTEVHDFKQNWCDENKIIPMLLKEKLDQYLVEPILDCGAGLGDIAFLAFHDKEATLIDVNPVADHKTKMSPKHTHKIEDFFDHFPSKAIGTLLISHTLQFLDDDLKKLNYHIATISPQYIILVANCNDDFMGELIEWTFNHYEDANPEVRIDNFPSGFKLVESVPFKATVDCRGDFAGLAKQISYLMMFDLEQTGEQLEQFLQKKLKEAKFVFHQVIEVYERSSHDS